MKAILNWLGRNIWTLLLSLVLAMTLWIVASQEQNPVEERQMTAAVPIQVIAPDAGLVIINELPAETRLRLRAQTDTWQSLSTEDVSVTADLRGLGPGTHQVELQMEVFARAVAVSANPGQIRVTLEREINRTMAVTFEQTGRTPLGYRTEAPTIAPATVTITGPETLVQSVDKLRAVADVTDLREDLDTTLRVQPIDRDGQPVEGLTLRTETVEVNLPVVQIAGFKDVAVRVVTVGQPARGYFVTSPAVSPSVITIQGDPALISTLPPLIETQPVDLTNLKGDLSIEVGLNLPQGVSAQPGTVQVAISISAQQGGRSIVVPVTVIGLANGLEATVTPGEVEVFLSGPIPVLDELSTTDVIIRANVRDLAIGSYQVPVLGTIAREQIVLESLLPATVEVQILPEGLNSADGLTATPSNSP
ncbi:MAG: hypothetical protein IT326_07650 [Anaerolineae bacterium]|nr:hypothetical protein [Anaerolineae bacterium]